MPEGLTRTFATMDEAISLLLAKVQENYLHRHPPDLYVRPEIPAGINVLSGYNRVEELIRAGEECALAALPELQSLVNQVRTSARPKRAGSF
jgi:hypothetical protein